MPPRSICANPQATSGFHPFAGASNPEMTLKRFSSTPPWRNDVISRCGPPAVRRCSSRDATCRQAAHVLDCQRFSARREKRNEEILADERPQFLGVAALAMLSPVWLTLSNWSIWVCSILLIWEASRIAPITIASASNQSSRSWPSRQPHCFHSSLAPWLPSSSPSCLHLLKSGSRNTARIHLVWGGRRRALAQLTVPARVTHAPHPSAVETRAPRTDSRTGLRPVEQQGPGGGSCQAET